MVVVFYGIALFSCLIGTICGMGGGVIIKPVLDASQLMPVATVNFLSGVTVVGMTLWSVGRTLIKGESIIDLRIGTLLALSAAIGGLAGKQLYRMVATFFEDPNTAGGIQGVLLFLATGATLIYTLRRAKIPPKQIKSRGITLMIGFVLGVFGAFLGIGGGPFNVAVLCYFFSMATKTATQNSLYIILFSQAASTGYSLIRGSVTDFYIPILLGMVTFGILGSELGRRLNGRLTTRQADWMLVGAMVLIMGLSGGNAVAYLL
ncbi:sulfite exporter TauE/SafE family protein [Eubacterium barkeri]|uniref:Probable membrane transporter protein n=1 Tax=Eubacterium barkeri TaxID=1528 RepID=A0A1H3DJK2_EUBBA|nr:sulfite exporter TauE/SafE family protein [Eubacterium barkeri]SDX65824.1 hypothetical protein SAMN04488579_1056 [Eubacterium barkeri]